MSYEDFRQAIMEELQRRLGTEVKVHIKHITKMNDQVKEGLTFQSPYRQVFPVIYLEDFYQYYQQDHELEECVKELLRLLEVEPASIKDEFSMEWETVRDKLRIQVINREWNEEILHDIPYQNFCDLAIVCRILFRDHEQSRASCLVRYSMLEYWGITEAQLWEKAFVNFRRETYTIQNLRDILAKVMPAFDEEEDQKDPLDLYVLTNKENIHGSAGILRTDLLEEFSKKVNADLYILPSSLHEVILLPASSQVDLKELRNMVRSVNGECVDPEERLSDAVYWFSKTKKRVECFGEKGSRIVE